MQADDLPPAFGVHRHGDYGGHRDNAPSLALAQIGGIQPQIGPLALQLPLQEAADAFVDVLAEFGDGGLGDAGVVLLSGLGRYVRQPGTAG